MSVLPIDPLLPEVVTTLRRAPSLVLEAPPGAGKTTRVPRALLEAGFAEEGEILVLQPRRLPTRLAAARVAEELGEPLGQRVGYQVRFEDVSGPKTRLRFLTEGVLTRRLLSDPELRGVSVVILDEFHERHIAADLAIAWLLRLQRSLRPDLKIVVTSATLEGERVADYLGGAPLLRSEGRRFDVDVQHAERDDPRPLAERVAGAVKRVVARGLEGHLLVFLPGAAEIRRAAEALGPFAQEKGLLVLPLHGDLPPEEQDRAVRPSRRTKVILSTNVAESSVTIDGVVAVVDSGLARVAGHSPWSGLPTLQIAKISQASATQRAGRAGRTRDGLAIRLYTREDFASRPAHERAEIQRLDLAETCLALRAAGLADPGALDWFEHPPEAAVEAAEELLRRLGAVDAEGRIQEIGKRLASLPVHPRLGRWIVEGERLGVGREACRMAALVAERDILRGSLGGRGPAAEVGVSDVLDRLERLEEAERGELRPQRLGALGLDTWAVRRVLQASRQLERRLRSRDALGGEEREEALLQVILRGFPDRVAKRRSPRSGELLLCGGGSVQLSESSVVQEGELLVVVEAEERGSAGGRGGVARLVSQVEADWLLDLEGDALRAEDQWIWNPEAERVEHQSRILYGAIALEESRSPAPPVEEAQRILVEQVLSVGVERFWEPEELEAWRVRLALAREHLGASFPLLDEEFLREVVEGACFAKRSFAELEGGDFLNALQGRLGPDLLHQLERHLPERIPLPGGRRVRIRYEEGRPPWIASRLQDFFGMREGPVLLGGRLPLTLHLLAPNQRPVQVTQDLAGFWERHYPSLRRELSRRYPKHAWPEDGATATPPSPHPRRARR